MLNSTIDNMLAYKLAFEMKYDGDNGYGGGCGGCGG